MAQNYLEFSEVLEDLTPEEIDWWKKEGERGAELYRKAEEEGVDVEPYEMEEPPSNDWEIEPRTDGKKNVWFHADENGDVEATASVIHRFLKAHRPIAAFTMTYAAWCSKPHIGEFSGGAVFITADGVEFQNAHGWIEEQTDKWSEKMGTLESK